MADMTFLKDKELIQLQPPSMYSTFSGRKDPPKHWSVEFQLVMVVDGRNLHYEARWPIPKEDDDQFSQDRSVIKKGQFSIAAAFQPGTS